MSTVPASERDLTRVVLSVLGIGALIAGSLWVLRPFIGPLLWATTIAVATWPVMLKIQSVLGGRRGAAVAVMVVMLLLAVFVPLFVAVETIMEQTDRVLEFGRALPTLRLPPPPPWLDSVPLVGSRASTRWAEFAALPPDELAQRFAPYIRNAVSWFAAQAGTVGGMLVHFLLTVLITAILYVKGEAGTESVRRFFRRLSAERGDAIVTLSGKAIRAVALGIVVTALLQTAIAAIGLYVDHVPFAGFLVAVVFVFCIAQIGPLLALIPPIVWLYAIGSPVRGTVLLVVALFAQAIDNIVRPVLIRRGADLSLLLILPGVIGGLLWLGIIGLFIGPVILAVTSTLLEQWVAAGLGESAPGAAPEQARTTAGRGGT
jgi:predicted PurR-regulated permease PerM